MSDFTLEITGTGRTISIGPTGTIDLEGAEMLLATVGGFRSTARGALLAIDLDGITGMTSDAARLLASNDIPVLTLRGAA
jgi:hypothetical protein